MFGTIILTGAIIPSWPAARNDPKTRLNDYVCAIRRWLDVPILEHVVFCDACGFHIPVEVFESEKFESFSTDASDLAGKYEAGRGELESIAAFLEHAGDRIGSFFKCTGRLYVENFGEIFETVKNGDARELFLRPWVGSWADTRFFWCRSDFITEKIVPRKYELTGRANRGHVIESLFWEYLPEGDNFPEPVFLGYEGHSNRLYRGDFSAEERDRANSLIQKYKFGKSLR